MAKLSNLASQTGEPDMETMRDAFEFLREVETGVRSSVEDLPNPKELRTRLELLFELTDLVPREVFRKLPDVLEVWRREFPDPATATIERLGEIARAKLTRRSRNSNTNIEPENGTRLAMELAGILEPEEPRSEGSDFSSAGDQAALRQCVVGLGVWFDRLTKDEWTRLPASVPGERASEIEKIYVGLHAVSDVDIEEGRSEAARRTARQLPSSQYPALDMPAMLARTTQRCVVIGEPGSGKSTLVRWLAWSVRRGGCPDFKAALVVKLGAYARELTENSDLSVIEFFFESLRTKFDDWLDASRALRRIASDKHRILLLLDGWDEVPPAQRDLVRERIDDERSYFVSLITSRASGMPGEFREGDRTDIYRIAGLTDAARGDLVRKLVAERGRPDLYESVSQRIENEPDLREMAANPFLLGLLVRVLSRVGDPDSRPRTVADVYRQVTEWVREQHNLFGREGKGLSPEHIAGMKRLSHSLLFGPDGPGYVFPGERLIEASPGVSVEPILSSRFVNKTDPVFDEYAFLHATIQEYFAAGHANSLSPSELDAFLHQTFRSGSRLIVLEFLAGLTGPASSRCKQLASEWLRDRDQYLQVTLRLARLVAAGRWPDNDPDGLAAKIKDSLWREIKRNNDMKLVRLAAEAMGEMDPTDLARRARAAKKLDNWAIDCILDSVPRSIRRLEQLDNLMKDEWKVHAGFDAKGGATPDEMRDIRKALGDPTTSEEDLREAIVQAGAARDSEAMGLLLELLGRAFAKEDTLGKILESLATIGGGLSVGVLTDVVIGARPLSADAVLIAVSLLRLDGHNKKLLDPTGRRRLLRRLAVLPTGSEHIESILKALAGSPIREGAGLLRELILRRDLRASLRAASVSALAGAVNRSLLRDLVATIGSESSSEVVDAILLLAMRRSIPLPGQWLRQSISNARDLRMLRKLLPSFLMSLGEVHGEQHDDLAGFLNRQLSDSLSPGPGLEESSAVAWEQALIQGPAKPEWLKPETVLSALELLRSLEIRPERTVAGSARLAACIASISRTTEAKKLLRDAFVAVSKASASASGEPNQDWKLLASTLVSRLADVDPGELLTLPNKIAEETLRARAIEKGWLVRKNHITDSEGREIASKGRRDAEMPVSDGPDPKNIGDRLPKGARAVFYSYWLMVHENGPCDPGDTLRQIYDQAADSLNSAEDSESSRLAQLFPAGLPKFETWKKAISRVPEHFKDDPAVLGRLRSLGLPRRNP